MSFKDEKPNIIPEGYYYAASEMDKYLAIVEPMAEKLEAIKKHWAWMMDGDVGSDSFWIGFNEIKEIFKEAS